ncbi:MAG TPA: PQQ-binding-like beta-propeller repeat protein [Steroidobacteraceae bacterium]|nr:PQQ-binding-like beta-propeller repeat protein [Steroidobacteraceae bacterium]
MKRMRRRHRPIGSAVAVLSLSLASAASGAADCSSMFHGNPQHTGVCPTDVREMKLLWRFHTGNMVRSTPAVVDGMVYVGSNDKHFYALDAKTGRLSWSFSARGGIASSPAVSHGRVWFADATNTIYALDARTGHLIWKVSTGQDLPVVGGWDFYQSSPTVMEGVLYVGSGDGHIYARDARTGRRMWAFATQGRVHTSPAVWGRYVVFGSMDGALYALDRRTGQLLWKHQTDTRPPFPMTGAFIGSPTIAADLGLVFAGCRDGYLYAFDIATGRLRWRLGEDGSWVVSTPAYEDGVVYATTSDTRRVQAVDARTGKIRWQQQGTGYAFPSPVVAPRAVYAAFWSAVVADYGKADGRAIAGNGGEGPYLSSPVIAHGVLFIGCDDGYLYAFH